MNGRENGTGRRWVIPTMVAVTVIVVVAVFALDRRGGSDGGDATVDTGAHATQPGPALPGATSPPAPAETLGTVPVPPAIDSIPSPETQRGWGDGPGSWDDATLLAGLYSFTGVATYSESVAARSTNTPQDEIAQCMSAAGFQYVEDNTSEEYAAVDPFWQLSAEEYAARYGFGIAAGDLGMLPEFEGEMANIDYQFTLTAGQREAYTQALHRCEGMTPERVSIGNAFGFALGQFRDLVNADDRVVDAAAVWSACMAAAGFQIDHPDAKQDSIYARYSSELSRAELERLLADEIALATANASCEAPYRDAYRTVLRDRLPEFRSMFDAAVASGAAPDAAG